MYSIILKHFFFLFAEIRSTFNCLQYRLYLSYILKSTIWKIFSVPMFVSLPSFQEAFFETSNPIILLNVIII